MSNPFDQFGNDLQAALPPQPAAAAPPSGAPPPDPFGGGGQPPMTNPYGASLSQQQQPPSNPYGAPPPPPPQDASPFGMAPQQQQQPQAPPSNPYGAPPSAAPPQENNIPPQQPGNPYGSPPLPQQQPVANAASQEANAFSSENNPYGAALAAAEPPKEASNPYGAPSQQPPQSDPFAAYGTPQQPPPPPQQQQQQPPPPQQPPADAAPVDASTNPYGAAPPASPARTAPEQMVDPWGQQQPPVAPPIQDMGAALVPSQQQSNPYGLPPQQEQPFQQQQYQQQQQPPYGGGPSPYDQSAMVPAPQAPNPYAPPAQPAYGYGAPPPQQPPQPVDPFSVFESQQQQQPAPAPEQTGVPAAAAGPDPTANDDDFWGSFGASTKPEEQPAETSAEKSKAVEEEKKNDEGLPPGGEWYDARIFTPTLGVMFFKPQELTDSLFLNTSKDVVDGLADRPVVAFIVEGSSARSAGVELGHVLLKVNGVDVRSPKEASRLIKEGPRPLPLLFYIPNTEVTIAEGEHMVKYDTRETVAPNSAKEWKPKYVVIGGIIAQPWMMNMYRSKSEYDIAVIETQARRPVSVKVKQFSLQGARIQNDWQGPQMVKYKNKLHPWKYVVVLPVARNPIKISSPNLSQLKPVHEGIRRVLLAQQRGRGGGSGGRQSAQNDYSRGERHDSHRQQNHEQYGHNHHQQAQQQQAYGY